MISDLLCQLGTHKSVGPDGILCQVFGRWNLCQRFGRIHSAGWWFRGYSGCAGWMVRLDDLKGLFQLWFCDYLNVFVCLCTYGNLLSKVSSSLFLPAVFNILPWKLTQSNLSIMQINFKICTELGRKRGVRANCILHLQSRDLYARHIPESINIADM